MKSSDSKHMINFGSGPAALPREVLQQASDAILDLDGSGLSVLEIPHRGKTFGLILEESKALVKELSGVDDDYEVLWLPGGGRLQFSMIPMNFLGEAETAGYIDSGYWSGEAMEYAAYYGNVKMLASSRKDNFTMLPVWPGNIPGDLEYVHFTTNNTIYGTQWDKVPACNVPLIADMSSDIFSRRMDYNNCALFYACAQKNIGPAGVGIAVIQKDFLKSTKRKLQPMLCYAAHAAKNSVLNTPPVFAIYTAMLMLRWTRSKGIVAIEQDNEQKASLLYNELGRNTLFTLVVTNPAHRSKMNVCFKTKDEATEKAFIHLCAENNITGIEGHRSVGGLRVSLYNAITIAQVEKLVSVMQEFEKIIINQ